MQLMYRPKDWNMEEKKMIKRGILFREVGAQTVIFVPNTPGSELEKVYEDEAQSMKVKIVESAVKSIKSMFQRSTPFKTSDCQSP